MTTEKVEYATEWCKYEFTEEEKRDIAERLAIKTQELEEAEDNKKSVMSKFKEKIEKIALEVKGSARMYKDGYEMKDIECVVERDFVLGEVRYIRTDNGEIARKHTMTMGERQMRIGQALKNPIQNLQDSLGPGESLTIESGGKSVTLQGEQTNEEIRQQEKTQREMSSEKSSL